MKMTGMSLSFSSAFMRTQTSYPSISGMVISSRTRSGGSFCAASSAIFPLVTGLVT